MYFILFFFLLYNISITFFFFFFSSRRRHTRSLRDWSSDVCFRSRAGGSDGDRQPGRSSSRVLHVVQREVAVAATKRGGGAAARPGAIDVVRHLAASGYRAALHPLHARRGRGRGGDRQRGGLGGVVACRVEGVDRVGVGGGRLRGGVGERGGGGVGGADGGAVAVDRVAGQRPAAVGGGGPAQRDRARGDRGGLQPGRDARRRRGAGSGGVERGHDGVPVRGAAERGARVLSPRAAGLDVFQVGRVAAGVRPHGERLARRGSRRDRARRPAGDDTADDQLTRAHRSGGSGVDRRAVPAGDRELVERAGGGHAAVFAH